MCPLPHQHTHAPNIRPNIYAPTCARSVNKANIELLKQRWVDAGRPRYPDWAALMAGVVDPTHMVPVQRPHG
jgi:hypothetical protein